LQQALSYAARKGVVAVVAAGNQHRIGGPALTGHCWTLPVIACDFSGHPIAETNLSASAAKWGLSAPGEVTSMNPEGKPLVGRGTSVAAAIVSATVALLWSEFPEMDAATIKLALTRSGLHRRSGLVPPVLNAWAAHQSLSAIVRQKHLARVR
jgi:subtilisin family serine protease